jgi:hypothetical protein
LHSNCQSDSAFSEISQKNCYLIGEFLVSDAKPTESETQTFELVQSVLFKSKDILHQLQTYKGAGNEIREVIFYYFTFEMQIISANATIKK